MSCASYPRTNNRLVDDGLTIIIFIHQLAHRPVIALCTIAIKVPQLYAGNMQMPSVSRTACGYIVYTK
jgi:hypothetical protein